SSESNDETSDGDGYEPEWEHTTDSDTESELASNGDMANSELASDSDMLESVVASDSNVSEPAVASDNDLPESDVSGEDNVSEWEPDSATNSEPESEPSTESNEYESTAAGDSDEYAYGNDSSMVVNVGDTLQSYSEVLFPDEWMLAHDLLDTLIPSNLQRKQHKQYRDIYANDP
ncbi:hypothetical protein LPJ53_006276, partial [Coemansia erecta]